MHIYIHLYTYISIHTSLYIYLYTYILRINYRNLNLLLIFLDTCQHEIQLTCENGGYQDPADCSQCRCPDGWTGKYCNHLQMTDKSRQMNKCGGYLNAESSFPKYSETPGFASRGNYDVDDECNWKIRAPVGERVVMWFYQDFGAFCSEDDVCYNWAEVRTGPNLGETGPR